MKLLPNYLQIAGWSGVLALTLLEILKNPSLVFSSEYSNPFGQAIFLMQIVQTAQFVDFFLSSGNILSVLAQYVGRMVVAWVHLNTKTTPLYIISLLLAWGTADIIRYSFYLKRNDFTSFLRFNAFIVLYPIGVFIGELPSIENFITTLEKTTKFYDYWILFSRVAQVMICIIMPILAGYLFKSRQSYYKKKLAEKKK